MSGRNLLVPDVASAADLRPLAGVRQQPTGSAKGNPRNKVALRPGYSLMDWIRLTKSGKDLAGTGGKILNVSPAELRKHNKRNDAWMALNGKVYNVTSYMDYHPGGWDELVRGAGKDATKLFNETHQWVNYESMLAACLVGKLVRDKPPPPSLSNSLKPPAMPVLPPIKPSEPAHMIRPTHDYHQTEDCVIISIYTKRKDAEFSQYFTKENVVVDVQSRPEKDGSISHWMQILVYSPYTRESGDNFRFYQVCYKLWAQVRDEERPAVAVGKASGKVEVKLRKKESGRRWSNIGVGLPGNDMHGDSAALKEKLLTFSQFRKWRLASRTQLTHDTYLYSFDPPYHCLAFEVPVGHHVTLRADVADELIVERPYTPVIADLLLPFEQFNSDQLHLAIKTYPDGVLTSFMDKMQTGDQLDVSNPTGKFRLSVIDGVANLILLAAGTGITPMVKVIRYFIDQQRGQSQPAAVRLVFFNKTEQDIVWKSELETLAQNSSPCVISVHHVLSQEEKDGYEHGRVNKELLCKLIPESLVQNEDSSKRVCLCGPIPFNNLTKTTLEKIGFKDSEIFVFQG